MTQKQLEKSLIELEHQYWQAIKDRDAKAAMKLTDSSCIVAGASGVGQIERKAFAPMIESAKYTLNDFELKDVKIALLTDDVAVLAYKVHEDLEVDGKPVSLDAADSSTWVKRDGHWVCALHTEAIAGDPFGRDRKPS